MRVLHVVEAKGGDVVLTVLAIVEATPVVPGPAAHRAPEALP
ncbi:MULTISPECIES: hypothetical protein [Nocardioides]|uniref:Uncharacterized protein n=1 Tax=Nocardioides vastitatis TaxID=2568655 RepID=A0ABW0ZB24_9ACTN|nr:hypothetical protein [Nocardioides sp.]